MSQILYLINKNVIDLKFIFKNKTKQCLKIIHNYKI